MKEWLLRIIGDPGPFGWLLIWFAHFVVPILCLSSGFSDLKGSKKRQRRGSLKSIISGLVSLIVIAWLLSISYGPAMVKMTIDSSGPWVLGLLAACLVCLLLLPATLVGFRLRLAYDCQRQGTLEGRGKTALRNGVFGLLAVSGLVFGVFQFGPIELGLVVSGAMILAVGAGVFRAVIVPDIGVD